MISQISQSLQRKPWHWKSDVNIFRVLLVCFREVLVSCFWAFVPVNLLLLCLGFRVFLFAKCCCSFKKFNTYFLWSLDSIASLFFRKWIFYKDRDRGKIKVPKYLGNAVKNKLSVRANLSRPSLKEISINNSVHSSRQEKDKGIIKLFPITFF